MKILINALLMMFLFSNAMAKDHSVDIALLKATIFAKQLGKAKNLEDLSNMLFLSEGDKKLFVEDLKKHNLLKSSLPKVSYNGTLVSIGEKNETLKFGFKDISNKILYLNEKKVNIKSSKSYISSLILVRDLLKRPYKNAFFNLFVNEAYARDKWSFDYVYAALITSQFNLEQLTIPNAALAETILQTYESELPRQFEYLNKTFNDDTANKHKIEYINGLNGYMRFSCLNGRLHEIKKGLLPFENLKSNKPNEPNYLKFNPSDNTFFSQTMVYSYSTETLLGRTRINYDERKCELEGNFNTGEVTKSREIDEDEIRFLDSSGAEHVRTTLRVGCPSFNIYSDENIHFGSKLFFGQFPKVADACCQVKGCEEKVNSGVDQIIQELKSKQSKPQPSSGVR